MHFLGFFLLIYLFLFLLLLSSVIFLRVLLIWLFLMNEGNGKLDWKWKHDLLYITHRSWINSNFQLWVAFYFFLWLFLMNEGNRKLDWKWKNYLLCLTHRSWINLNFQLVATSFLGLHVLCWLAYLWLSPRLTTIKYRNFFIMKLLCLYVALSLILMIYIRGVLN